MTWEPGLSETTFVCNDEEPCLQPGLLRRVRDHGRLPLGTATPGVEPQLVTDGITEESGLSACHGD